jgi:tetratricopeptide (TPR) repeat protein
MQAEERIEWPAKWLSTGALVLIVAVAAPARAQDLGICGTLANGFGPFDYRKDRGNNLYLVESAHFTPQVEALVRSVTGYLGGDIDYTLRAYPNHHKALVSMMRLGERLKARQVPKANWEVECYFVRATAFAPDDPVVRMLYAGYLNKQQRRDAALQQLSAAERHAGENPFTHYNLGLNYLELAAHDKALKHAHRAMELGFPRTELKDRLAAAGKWSEPAASGAAAVAPEPVAAPASAAPASAASASAASAPS